MFDFNCGIMIHHVDWTQKATKASTQPSWFRSPALQTKPHELVTAMEWFTALETKGTLDLSTQLDLYKTVAMIRIEVDKITPFSTHFSKRILKAKRLLTQLESNLSSYKANAAFISL